ncbi:DUF4019 domain-containing protein [Salinisphaera sp. T31B1]|uniref:DUF4019 domain-containing protein n=1 Tax=Salinisphaera sp. T31B1 TaxID=727963 RepID=UPI00333E5714
MKPIVGLVIVACLVCSGSAAFAQNDTAAADSTSETPQTRSIAGQPLTPRALAAALSTVNALLGEMNDGQSAPGYDLLAPSAQETETQAQWNSLFTELHDAAGARKRSTFGFALRTDQLPNARPGEYVVIGLNSDFEKASLAETIILTDVNGRYLISGYHFQNRSPTVSQP